jgi:hypothetical protein
VSSISTIPNSEPNSSPLAAATPHFLADLYTFDLTAFSLRLPLISTVAVALCLVVGIAVGHPGGALLAAGGAFTVGFGANQRISDSRLLPIVLAIFAMSTATLAGTLVGHRGYALILASAVAAAIYGVLTIRHSGLAWVGQQAAVTLFVSSAFPLGPHAAFLRAGLTALGGVVQLLITAFGLRMLPELRRDLAAVRHSLYTSLYEQRSEILHRLRELPNALPAPDRATAALYALRLVITVSLASEVYRRLDIQSGYWIPMTALLVQKPAFFETLSRGLARTAGTLLGATLATLIATHLQLSPWTLAALATVFALWCFATVSVNYGLFSVGITSYIVFLLSLNQIPGPELAYRRAYCTAFGAVIALIIHLDALRRHQIRPTFT